MKRSWVQVPAESAGRAIEPRKVKSDAPRRRLRRRPHFRAAMVRRRKASRGRNHGTHGNTPSGPGRSSSRPAVARGRNGKEGKPKDKDERLEEVRLGHSSKETGEQRAARPGGAGGAKGRGQGKFGTPKQGPRTEAGKPVTGGGPDTASCKEKTKRASCGAPTPYHGARAENGVLLDQERRCRRCGWRDMGRVCTRACTQEPTVRCQSCG